jgi:hypothetical protein
MMRQPCENGDGAGIVTMAAGYERTHYLLRNEQNIQNRWYIQEKAEAGELCK